jgi:hypothetical protein
MQNNENKSTETPVIGITKEQTFDYFFREYYAGLCFFAQSIVHNEEEAKDIVQDCFVKLWGDDTITERASSVKSFLYTMVHNSKDRILIRGSNLNRETTLCFEQKICSPCKETCRGEKRYRFWVIAIVYYNNAGSRNAHCFAMKTPLRQIHYAKIKLHTQ